MTMWKKKLHIAIIFILIVSLFSPVTAIKAQDFEGDLLDPTTNINGIEPDDSGKQDNATGSDNEKEVEHSAEQENALQSVDEIESDNLTQLGDATEVAPYVEVAPLAISDVQLNTEEPLLLLVGETFQLTATNSTTGDSATVMWSSGNSGIATVDTNGNVIAQAIGETVITAQLDSGTKEVKVYVISPEAREAIDFIIALPTIERADESTYQLLLEARELEIKVKEPARTLLRSENKLPYIFNLLEKEITYFRYYMQDPNNAIPAPEEIISLSDELDKKLEAVRGKYNSLIKPSGYRDPKKVTDPADILAFNQELAAKEVKYTFLAIDALPKLEDLTIDSAIKEQLDYARKKYAVIPTAEQKKVANKGDLFAKEVKYVELLIDAIDINSPLAEEQLKTAKEALKKLANPNNIPGVSKGVSNYNDLLDKEKMINAEDDIKQVIEKIGALPTVEALTWADQLKVLEAQQAYDKLLFAHKSRVTNYKQLEALQKRLVELQPTTVEIYTAVANYLTKGAYEPVYGSEWTILTLARGDNTAKYATYYDKYYRNLVSHVKATNGEIGTQATDWARVIIALTAIGKDPKDVAGYNLVEKLSDLNFATSPGVNSTIFSLIALDTWGFELPKTATTTRDKLIQNILSKEIKNGGGFAWSGTDPDPDMTGMVLQALAPYQSNPQVKAVTDRSIAKLLAIQTAKGGYISTAGSPEAAESAAQVITALASLGIDANKDKRFDKVIANIMTFSSGDGGFKHVQSQSKADGMATVQVGYTLAAYNRLLSGQTPLYDMSDTKNKQTKPGDEDGSDDDEHTSPGDNGNQPSIPTEKEEIGYTTFSIQISSSEVPLKPIATKLFTGETVFDVLKRVTAENGVALSYRQTEYGTYIDGIAGVFEFDRGPLSGWMYRVNGVFPSFSAANYALAPNDSVEWIYTRDLGKDIGGYVEDVEKTPEQDKVDEEKKEVEKENTDKEAINDKTVTDVTEESSKNGKTEITLTLEDIQKHLENQSKTIVVEDEKGNKIDIPISGLSDVELAKNEKIIASVTTHAENNQFTISFAIEASNGELKPLSIKQDYLKVTLATFEVKPNTVVLQLIDGEYKPVPHKIVNGKIVLFLRASGTFIVTERTVTFNDIAHLANKEEIEFLASRSIIQGTTPETFEPNKPITRAQFAVLISRALGLRATGDNPFNDTDGKWYAADIQALYEAGITKGTTASTFNPEAPITRQQGAAFMARILEYLNTDVKATGKVNFNDANNISAEYLPYIELLNSLDIMTGKPNGLFDPRASLTRGQTAKILKRTLNIADIM
ncbi:S-layer homology domain-containing protein [Lysinibacillus sp. NPDC047702]|uniref:S-layer homology domain-containing protein n=1 Tax=unclassified Lysinibacillus TaxID=2636778 RepID=UPI003D085949